MNGLYDYKKFAILYVDDEEKSLKYFTLAFEPCFRIFTATNAEDGFRILEEHADTIGLLLTDQRMPGEKGVQLLERARQLRPRVLRFLVTAYSDVEAAIQAVNSGAIYKYISKPWDIPQLEQTLRRALEFFIIQRERDGLLREKLSVLHNMMITDRILTLGIVAAGLSHHVRNSLVAVQTFLDLAPGKMMEEKLDMEALRNPNYWQDFYNQVRQQVRRITDLLCVLNLATERTPAQFNDTVRLPEVLAATLGRLEGRLLAKKIVVQNQLPVDLPDLKVDLVKFQRMFDLLLTDEVVSLPEGSCITLRATARDQSSVQLEVSDNGPGLPEESLRSVFDPFFIRNDDPKEFGINLMACYFIVYHHGGKIQVESQPGRGLVFRLTFPVSPQSEPAAQIEKDFLSKVLMNETLWERLLVET